MKIAVISDLHGNMEAIRAVMDDINKNECEKIFVLGDYAMAGPEPEAAISYFLTKISNPKYAMIQGNTDSMIANYSEDIYNSIKDNAPIMAAALKDDISKVGYASKEFLQNLPLQIEVEVEGVKFLLVHGSPRKNNEDILPDTPPEEVEKMLKNVDADVVLCGHTHIPCGFQTATKQTVVNAGSVGRPFTPEPKSCYLIVDVQDGKCIFEHHFVSYDIDAAAEKLIRRDFYGADKLAGMLYNPKERHF